jgi:hypothetical protein
MPNINVQISDELMRDVKIACAVAEQTQKEFVYSALRLACLKATGQIGTVRTVVIDEERDASTLLTKIPEGYGWNDHDPKTCRVYRCGLCAAIKT